RPEPVTRSPDDQRRDDRKCPACALRTEPQRRPKQERERQVDERRRDGRREGRVEDDERHREKSRDQRAGLERPGAPGGCETAAPAPPPRRGQRAPPKARVW